MDAPLKLATTDADRWSYVASVLRETSERNERTAVILERLAGRLDSHDQLFEEHTERLTKLEHAASTAAGQGEPSDEVDDAPAAPTTVAAVLNRVYNDVRLVFLAGGAAGGLIIALFSHLGLSWH